MRAKTRRIRSPNGSWLLADEAGHGLQVGGDRLAHHRPEQVLLGLEIEIERALRDPGPGGDVVQPRGGEALLGKHRQGRGDDLAGPGLAASSPFGLAGLHGRCSIYN